MGLTRPGARAATAATWMMTEAGRASEATTAATWMMTETGGASEATTAATCLTEAVRAFFFPNQTAQTKWVWMSGYMQYLRTNKEIVAVQV